jgi:hypothetical protein
MGTLSTYLTDMQEGPMPCSVCGQETKYGSLWRGHQDIVICLRCAYDNILPALLADAFADKPAYKLPWDYWERALQTFSRHYWRAVAIALTRRENARTDALVAASNQSTLFDQLAQAKKDD